MTMVKHLRQELGLKPSFFYHRRQTITLINKIKLRQLIIFVHFNSFIIKEIYRAEPGFNWQKGPLSYIYLPYVNCIDSRH